MAEASKRIYTPLKDGATVNMAVNGSVTPVTYKYTCPSGSFAHLSRCLIQISDGTANTFGTFGGVAALTNGVDFGVYDSDDNQLLDLTGGVPWQTNGNLEGYCFDVRYEGRGSVYNTTARWTFTRDADEPLILEPGAYLGLVVNDDLTGLISYSIGIRGHLQAV